MVLLISIPGKAPWKPTPGQQEDNKGSWWSLSLGQTPSSTPCFPGTVIRIWNSIPSVPSLLTPPVPSNAVLRVVLAPTPNSYPHQSHPLPPRQVTSCTCLTFCLKSQIVMVTFEYETKKPGFVFYHSLKTGCCFLFIQKAKTWFQCVCFWF